MTPRTRKILVYSFGALGQVGAVLTGLGYPLGLVPMALSLAVLLPMAYPHIFRRLLPGKREVVKVLVEARGTPKGTIEGRVAAGSWDDMFEEMRAEHRERKEGRRG